MATVCRTTRSMPSLPHVEREPQNYPWQQHRHLLSPLWPEFAPHRQVSWGLLGELSQCSS